MDILGILGIFGFIFAATTAGALIYERETDVLHWQSIEGRVEERVLAAVLEPVRPIVEAVMERINWQARGAIYLASLA
jgi:hypothetical protein